MNLDKYEKNIKMFFIGEFFNNTGPGIANNNFFKAMPKTCKKNDAKTKVGRYFQMVVNIIVSDAICICGFTQKNILAIKIAKIFKKKIFYIMHGWIKFESKINNISNEDDIKYEEYILNNVNKVYCVSQNFANIIKENYPNISKKIDYIYNGIDWEKIENISNLKIDKDENLIMSIGGGIPIKNNYTICKAIDMINKKHNMNLKFLVVGNPSEDKEKIIKYDFVEYHDSLSYKETIENMMKSQIYIQNSTFETFGLAVVEAIASNCQVLVSKNVGAIGIIKGINNDDIINDEKDVEEIAKKILELKKNKQKGMYMNNINREESSAEERSKELYNKILLEIKK